jgi:superfamily II DNA or RNA helicase
MEEAITKENLIKTDPDLKNRPYQLDALLSIFLYAKCLIKMFCGTGKSRIITNTIIHAKKNLSVIVFPSLALISQYYDDYLNNEGDKKHFKKHFKKHKKMNVSSESLTNIKSTTDPKEIKHFIKGKDPKIILVTYQSLDVLLSCLEGQKIGIVCYDEAHHITSPEYQKLVFGTPYFEKEVFFTATPRNENGITMYDRDDPEKNMCGPVAYEYTYLQGLKDKVLNAFEICVDMYTENTNRSIYEAIARAILTKGTSRVLTYHSGVKGESNTDVLNFVKEEEFRIVFQQILMAEFREKALYYTKITFKGMDAKTPAVDIEYKDGTIKVVGRKTILRELDATPNNEIYIISSCETIGEGVDTKNANMCVFADPKSSIIKIIQNIGRVLRRNEDCPTSTILIPCWIDKEKYEACQGDKVKQDEIIRQQMREGDKGDFACILNVLAALKQEDPELYDACLNYPTKAHKEDSLNEQGFHIAESEDDDSDAGALLYSAEDVQQMKDDGEIPLEIHTNETIERFNEEVEEEPLMRLYHDEEEGVYKEIIPNEKDEEDEDEDERRVITPPPKRKVSMKFHMSSDVQMLWSITPSDLDKNIRSAIIECEVIKVDQMEIAVGIVERAKAREVEGNNLLPKYIHKEKRNAIEEQETKDHKRLGRWKRGESICPNVVKVYLTENLINWNYVLTNENKEIKTLKFINEIINRGNERVKNGGNMLPSNISKPTTKELRQEDLDRKKIGNLRVNCLYTSVKTLLDIHIPEWNNVSDWASIAIKEAQNIIRRAEERVKNHKKILPTTFKHPKNKDEEQEVDDKSKLSSWHRILSNPDKRGVCSPEVKKILDEKMPGWRPIDKNEKSLMHAEGIIQRAKERQLNKLNLLPSSSNILGPNQERNDYCKLRDWRDAVENKLHMLKTGKKLNKSRSSCSDEVRDLLDKELPEWRPTQLQEVEAIATLPKSIRKKKTLIIVPTNTTKETKAQTTPHIFPPISEISKLHKTYLRMRSDTLNEKFKSDPQLWRDYHTIRNQNFATLPSESIPYNMIIQELEKIKTKRQKIVVDMGCGEAPIAHHFLKKNDTRFTFHNYDHQSGGDKLIQEIDISALPLEDASAEIVIMSLALWGTHDNCIQYIKEAYRVLESGGKFYISDSTKKWSPEPLTQENSGELLRTLLTQNGFQIINEDVGLNKFCLFVCSKIY